MNRALLFVACAAALLANAPAEARMDWNGANCLEPQVAPDERIKYCVRFLNENPISEGEMQRRRAMLAEAYRVSGDFGNAENILDAVLAQYPDAVEQLMSRSVVLAEEGKYDTALIDANHVLALEPDAAGYNNRRWMRGIAGKKLDSAIQDCQTAIKARPDLPAIADSLAFAYYKKGDLKAAKDQCDATLAILSQSWPSLYMRGIIERQMDDADGGQHDIDVALQHYHYLDSEYAGYGVKP
jgi:tetratricopeptide (TPR) repeat protein